MENYIHPDDKLWFSYDEKTCKLSSITQVNEKLRYITKIEDKMCIMDHVANSGNFNLLKKLYSLGYPFSRETSELAIRSGNLKMVKWVFHKDSLCNDAYKIAVNYGKVDIMNWIGEKFYIVRKLPYINHMIDKPEDLDKFYYFDGVNIFCNAIIQSNTRVINLMIKFLFNTSLYELQIIFDCAINYKNKKIIKICDHLYDLFVEQITNANGNLVSNI